MAHLMIGRRDHGEPRPSGQAPVPAGDGLIGRLVSLRIVAAFLEFPHQHVETATGVILTSASGYDGAMTQPDDFVNGNLIRMRSRRWSNMYRKATQ